MEASASESKGYLKKSSIKNVIVISDTHFGCRMALCPPQGMKLDDGGEVKPSAIQSKVWDMWCQFWNEWVPEVTRGEPYAVVHNGDCIDGVHHGATTQMSHNLLDQEALAVLCLKQVVDACEGRYYHIRGTEAHVGQSAVSEERVAKALGAIPNKEGQHARYDLWLNLRGHLCHFLHHVGTTSSAAYESTAVHKELTETYIECARWGSEVPEVIVRSHRHRSIEIRIATAKNRATAMVTPAWQVKTPFAWKVAGARISTPQIGGAIIRVNEFDECFTSAKVWNLERSTEESI